MLRTELEQRLAQASRSLVALNRSLVLEAIPDLLEFAVAIQPWPADLPKHPDDRVFPEDPIDWPEHPRRRLGPAGLLDLLWRDGLVPRWIDVVIVAVDADVAVVRTDVSARFTRDPSLLHNPHNEDSPFLVKTVGPPPWTPRSPTRMPLERYSLHWRRDPPDHR